MQDCPVKCAGLLNYPIMFVSPGSHWEKRLLMNEIMTGSVDTRSVVSAMTLALLEDSGWYKANYSMAEHLDWGRKQGVDFLTSRCDDWNGAYHCNNNSLSGCTFNREAEGYCPIVNYNGDLPPWARYFPEANKGTYCALSYLQDFLASSCNWIFLFFIQQLSDGLSHTRP